MLAKSTVLRLLLAASSSLFSTVLIAQKTITGKITDANGQPVAGATVAVRGSNLATQTNSNGEYTITVPNANSRLVISICRFRTAGYFNRR